MAKLTWTITVNAGVVAHDGPEISEANMQRFRDWLWVTYPQLNPDGTTKTRNAANEAQAFRDWAQAQWQGTVANVKNYEEERDVKPVRDAVKRIDEPV